MKHFARMASAAFFAATVLGIGPGARAQTAPRIPHWPPPLAQTAQPDLMKLLPPDPAA
jgi:hypothetical protein